LSESRFWQVTPAEALLPGIHRETNYSTVLVLLSRNGADSL